MVDKYLFSTPIVTIFVLATFLYIIGRIVISRQSRTILTNNLKVFAFMVLIAGWGIYFYGYWQFYDEELNLISLTLRSFLSSIGMFALQSDLQYFAQAQAKNAPVFLSLFAIIHFLAALVSATFVINYVGVKIIAWQRMRKAKGQNLYIFWGINDNSIILADNIHKKNIGGMIIFVGTPKDAEAGSQQISLSSLINGQAQRKDRIRRIESLNAIITYCSEDLTLESLSSEDSSSRNTDNRHTNIFESIGLVSLAKMIKKSKDQSIKIFFLSNDEKHNLESTSLLLDAIEKNDEDLCGCQFLDIYCRARKNKENSVFEKMAYIKTRETLPNVHLIDSANLAVQILKKNVDYQPISFVTPNTGLATVENPFTALVIGFGETGRDAVRFLYEFGAFPNSIGKKSAFKCYAIDKQMKNLSGLFYNSAPALKKKNEIELLQIDCLSLYFWKWLEDKINILNYIIISLGNDEIEIRLAINLLEKAYRSRKTTDLFKIFIRSYAKENERRMTEIVDFYNQKVGHNFVVFGKQEELYTYNNVIDEDAIKQAKVFFTGYAHASLMNEKWEERHMMNGKNKEDISLDDINAVIRKENQDIANYRHIDTKLKLVGLNWNSTKEEFDKLTDIQKMNLAICEHLRWVASHEILGYVYDEENSNIRKTHNCLKPWQELKEEYQKFDYSVIERTTDIVLNHHENKEL